MHLGCMRASPAAVRRSDLLLGDNQHKCIPGISAAGLCQADLARPSVRVRGPTPPACRLSSRRRSLAVSASAVVSEPAVVARSVPVPAPAPPAPATELVPPAGAYTKVQGRALLCSDGTPGVRALHFKLQGSGPVARLLLPLLTSTHSLACALASPHPRGCNRADISCSLSL